jgi:hypothetical protein
MRKRGPHHGGLDKEAYAALVACGAVDAYNRQKCNAGKRGIGWNLTLGEWWRIWSDSGKWAERGRGRGKYHMARNRDGGTYAAGNVRIIVCEDNLAEEAEIRRQRNIPTDGYCFDTY